MDYENDKDAEDAMDALKGRNMGGRPITVGKFVARSRLPLCLEKRVPIIIFRVE